MHSQNSSAAHHQIAHHDHNPTHSSHGSGGSGGGRDSRDGGGGGGGCGGGEFYQIQHGTGTSEGLSSDELGCGGNHERYGNI